MANGDVGQRSSNLAGTTKPLGQAEAIEKGLAQRSEAADTGLGPVTQSEVAGLEELALFAPDAGLGRSLYRFDAEYVANTT